MWGGGGLQPLKFITGLAECSVSQTKMHFVCIVGIVANMDYYFSAKWGKLLLLSMVSKSGKKHWKSLEHMKFLILTEKQKLSGWLMVCHQLQRR